MKNWAFIVCIALLLASCNSILSSKPMGILSEKQMTDLLVDIHLTEAILKTVDDSIERKSDTAELRNRFAEAFKKHDVNPDDFNASLNYYLEHIEEIDKIYVEVINRLTELDATLVPLTKPDSNRPTGSPNLNNPWQRALNRTQKSLEFQYFDGSKFSYLHDERPAYQGPGKIIER